MRASGGCIPLGDVKGKFIVSPDFKRLLEGIKYGREKEGRSYALITE